MKTSKTIATVILLVSCACTFIACGGLRNKKVKDLTSSEMVKVKAELSEPEQNMMKIAASANSPAKVNEMTVNELIKEGEKIRDAALSK